MITLLTYLTMNTLFNCDTPKQEKLLYVADYCFTEWKEHGKEANCFSITLLKTEIDSITYMLQSNCNTTIYKKNGRKLFFKNEANPQYKLLFDFENLKGGYNIKRPYKDGMYKIAYKKFKYKNKYLYGLSYEPIGFRTTEHRSVYYFDEDGECVMMITGGYALQYYLRVDYFDKELSCDKKGNKYYED